MKIPAAPPITPAQSRDARRGLGLSQTKVIQQSGLPGHKLKHFETGSYQPDLPFLKQLSDFYVALGVDLSDDTVDATPPAGLKPGAAMIRTVHRPCFFVSEKVSAELLDQCLERMHLNDERIASLLKVSLKSQTILGGHSEETVAEHQELFGAMAENYLIFRLLQGNPIVEPVDGVTKPTTHAHLLGQFYAKSPVVTGEPIEPAQPPAPAADDEEEEVDE